MKVETIYLKSGEQVTLTKYLLDPSEEMQNAKVRPAILICPGGGYTTCSDREAEPVAMAFLAEGYHAFVLRYSVKERAVYPQPLRDAEAALLTIHKNGKEWGVDTEKIAVCGFSAGGHLASALGTMGSIRPSAMILGYPVIYEVPKTAMAGIPSTNLEVNQLTPPTFIFTANDDVVVPISHSLQFMMALDAADIPFESHIYKSGGHGFSLSKQVTASGKLKMTNSDNAKWFESCISWLHSLGWSFPLEEDVSKGLKEYHIDLPLNILFGNEECKKIIFEFMPQLEQSSKVNSVLDIHLKRMIEYSGEVPKEVIEKLNQRLKGIPIDSGR